MGYWSEDQATDATWEAVEKAISAGWTPDRFRQEVLQAWFYETEEEADRQKRAAKRALGK